MNSALVFGVTLPAAVSAPREEGGIVNVPAMFIVLAVTGVLLAGVRQSARTNKIYSSSRSQPMIQATSSPIVA